MTGSQRPGHQGLIGFAEQLARLHPMGNQEPDSFPELAFRGWDTEVSGHGRNHWLILGMIILQQGSMTYCDLDGLIITTQVTVPKELAGSFIGKSMIRIK